MKLVRTDRNHFLFEIVRTGGTAPLSVDLELGLFGERLESQSYGLLSVSGRPDLLRAQAAMHPSRDSAEPETIVFRWKSVNQSSD
jgi:hypothetical protein